MSEKNSIGWISMPTSHTTNAASMSIEEMIEKLEKQSSPENAAAIGEIKGLFRAYKLSPSTALLELIVIKCLTILLDMQATTVSSMVPVSVKACRTHPTSMDWEWVQGFDYFLLLNGISENSRQVYIRALKRVMKNHGIANVEELKERISELIDEYAVTDKKAHNVHISALRQFKDFMLDGCGFFITVEQDGEETIIDRIYCNQERAVQAFENAISKHCDTADKLRLYDKFAKLIKEHIIR